MALSNSFFDGKGIMKARDADVARYAQILSAMGTEPRLQIMRLLLSAHPDGMIVGDIQSELKIPASTLSHHLEKLKNVGLARVQREHCCLWYSANTEILQELLAFLFEECCSKNRAVKAEKIFRKCK
jgi:DNA-binding transcriptional ArsR family regulator